MGASLEELKTNGLQVVRGFYGDQQDELVRRRAEVMDGLAAGTFQRSGQFVVGVPNDWFDGVARDPRLLDLVSAQLGPDICLFSGRVLMKDHHFNGEVLIHQDWPYYGGGGPNKLNVFVPLTPVHRGNGALVFFEGSHDFGPLERGAIDAAQFPDLAEACPELGVGDVLLAHFLTWHYSVPATVAEDRIIVQLIYQPADDASSKNLLTGEIRNPRWLPNRWDAMKIPVSQLSVATAKMYFASGDMERAERYARGVLSSDPDNPDAALVLYDVFKARADPAADHWIDLARNAADRINAELTTRCPAPNPEPESPAKAEPALVAGDPQPEPSAPPAAPPWTVGRVARGLARRLRRA